ncbi:sulfur carrier protein ThiS [Methylomagnum ishizawai]|uniref:sulfur carrier protein ThiS n=1 Tax=Methylomagnum ishizawai TaxID=1760988 RepID=UPI001C341D29|nr:sulfur carrier protein ThiS [Methylomagnum ishizawai]BBL73288.1 thiamine biosynthesis protein ThiS [Methylomagnum ishizawai]
MSIRITINQKPYDLPEDATLAEALARFGAAPPFAVAVNLQFVHRHLYGETRLHAGDAVEVVQPVAGG